MQNQTTIQKEHFHFGHLGMVLSVAVLLLGISWMKDPQLFSVFSSGDASRTSSGIKIPQYYAYQEPSLDQSQVAGATAPPVGPQIINEDGTLSPALEPGEVLGINTEDIKVDLQSLQVKSVSDSDEARQNYINQSQLIEGNYLNSLEFENALSSNNQFLIDEQSEKVGMILSELLALEAPESLVNFHKLKIIQYQSAKNILDKFTTVDSDPDSVVKSLGIFLKTQEDLQAEFSRLGGGSIMTGEDE